MPYQGSTSMPGKPCSASGFTPGNLGDAAGFVMARILILPASICGLSGTGLSMAYCTSLPMTARISGAEPL